MSRAFIAAYLDRLRGVLFMFAYDDEALGRAAQQAPPGLLDGRALKRAMLDQLAAFIASDAELKPRLLVVQVGDDPASSVYVRNKVRASAAVGIDGEVARLSASVSQRELVALVERASQDASTHGILVQLPLPAQIEERAVLDAIAPEKDVDGFHPLNLGGLMSWRSRLEPCTPRGVMTMLRAWGVETTGQRAVVVGRSLTVGRPMAQMLTRADATVTVCHRRTTDLESHVRQAEILVVAVGRAGLIRGEWIRPGAVVVDVGINRTREGTLVGDVEFARAKERARLITPVPGGVGQLTVATLLENTVRAALGARES